jgi:AraC-like DNA-binding protein
MFDFLMSLFDYFSGDEVNEIAQDAYEVGFEDGETFTHENHDDFH